MYWYHESLQAKLFMGAWCKAIIDILNDMTDLHNTPKILCNTPRTL